MSESTTISQKNIDKLNKQLKDNFKKAFFDLLKQKVAENPPDYDWITKLYTEIQFKLKKLLKPTNPLYKEIEEHMDIQLFDQMIRNNAFNGVDFYNLINYVFELIKKLGSPARDNLADSKKEEILNIMKNGGRFSEYCSYFL